MTTLELDSPSLNELASKYFRRLKYVVRRQVELEGRSGRLHKFDLVLSSNIGSRVAWVRDWNRSVGINVAIALDIAASDVRLPSPIIIAREFSDDVKSYAKRRGLFLLNRRDILATLRLNYLRAENTPS